MYGRFYVLINIIDVCMMSEVVWKFFLLLFALLFAKSFLFGVCVFWLCKTCAQSHLVVWEHVCGRFLLLTVYHTCAQVLSYKTATVCGATNVPWLALIFACSLHACLRFGHTSTTHVSQEMSKVEIHSYYNLLLLL